MVELVQRVLNGEASRSEMKSLSKAIIKDKAVRRHYLDMMMLHGALEDTLQVDGASGKTTPFPSRNTTQTAITRYRKPVAIAASIAAMATIAAITLSGDGGDPALFEVVSIRGKYSGNLPAVGGAITEGQVITLTEGIVEITSSDDNHLLFQGPGELRILNQNRLMMTSGRLLADLNGASIRIEVPNAIITDIGTTFGIHQQSATATRVDVFDGAVSFADPQHSSKRELISAGESVTLDGAEWNPVKGTAETSLYPPKKILPLGFTFSRYSDQVPMIEADTARGVAWTATADSHGTRQLAGTPVEVDWVGAHTYSLVYTRPDGDTFVPIGTLHGKHWKPSEKAAAKALGFDEHDAGIILRFSHIQDWLGQVGAENYQVTLWTKNDRPIERQPIAPVTLFTSNTTLEAPSIFWNPNTDDDVEHLVPHNRGVVIKHFEQSFSDDTLSLFIPGPANAAISAVILTPVE